MQYNGVITARELYLRGPGQLFTGGRCFRVAGVAML